MTLLALLKRAFAQIDQFAGERLTYQQLSQLDPHLLEDIGLRLEDRRVVPLHNDLPDPQPTPAKTGTSRPLAVSQRCSEPKLQTPLPDGGG